MKDVVNSLVLVTGATEGGGPWGGNGVWAYRRDGVGEGQRTEGRSRPEIGCHLVEEGVGHSEDCKYV